MGKNTSNRSRQVPSNSLLSKNKKSKAISKSKLTLGKAANTRTITKKTTSTIVPLPESLSSSRTRRTASSRRSSLCSAITAQSNSNLSEVSQTSCTSTCSTASSQIDWKQTLSNKSVVRIVCEYNSKTNKPVEFPQKVAYVLNEDNERKTRVEIFDFVLVYLDDVHEFLDSLRENGIDLDPTLDCVKDDETSTMKFLMDIIKTSCYTRARSTTGWKAQTFVDDVNPTTAVLKMQLENALVSGMSNGGAKTFIGTLFSTIISNCLKSGRIVYSIPDDHFMPVQLIDPQYEHLEEVLTSKIRSPNITNHLKNPAMLNLYKDVKPDGMVAHAMKPKILLTIENKMLNNPLHPAYIQSVVEIISQMRYQKVGFGLVLNGKTWNMICLIKVENKIKCYIYSTNLEKTVTQKNREKSILIDVDSFEKMCNMCYMIFKFGDDVNNLNLK